MRYFSWDDIDKLLMDSDMFSKYASLPTAYSSLDEWLEIIDERKCDIVAAAIGCGRAKDLGRQQLENMVCRRRLASSFEEWRDKLLSNTELGEEIDAITEDYAKTKRCHRRYSEERPGVVCYCDER